MDRESDEYNTKKPPKKVMMEDGLEDVDDLIDPEKEKQTDTLKLFYPYIHPSLYQLINMALPYMLKLS